jgi:HD-like signal output (HDOD) protein
MAPIVQSDNVMGPIEEVLGSIIHFAEELRRWDLDDDLVLAPAILAELREAKEKLTKLITMISSGEI